MPLEAKTRTSWRGKMDCALRSQDAVATLCGLTRQNVSMIEMKAFRKLRASRKMRAVYFGYNEGEIIGGRDGRDEGTAEGMPRLERFEAAVSALMEMAAIYTESGEEELGREIRAEAERFGRVLAAAREVRSEEEREAIVRKRAWAGGKGERGRKAIELEPRHLGCYQGDGGTQAGFGGVGGKVRGRGDQGSTECRPTSGGLAGNAGVKKI